MKPLGTILPTRSSLASSDAYFAQWRRVQLDAATRILSQYTHRHVDGEDRYYDGEDRYAVISFHTLRAVWFHRKADGYWYAGK